MAKNKSNPQSNELVQDTEFGRGEIKDNALKAVVTSQLFRTCLLYTSPSPRDPKISRMPSSA